MTKARGAYSWAGNLFHTRQKIFQSGKIAASIYTAQAYPGGMRAQDTDTQRGHIARR